LWYNGGMDWLQIFFIIGAVAGIISLYWKIDNWLSDREHRPKIYSNTEIIYEEEVPKSIRVKTINNGGRTLQIIKVGFELADKTVYYHEFTGLLLHWVRSCGGKHEEDFALEEMKNVLMKQESNIKRAFIQSDEFKTYYSEVPDDLNTNILK